jgi:hypothetical protein
VTYSPAFRQGLLKQQGLTAPLFALAGVVHALRLLTPPHGHVPWSDHNRNDALVLIVISFPRRDSWGILDSYTWGLPGLLASFSDSYGTTGLCYCEVRYGRHCVFQLHVHLVGTQYRYRIFNVTPSIGFVSSSRKFVLTSSLNGSRWMAKTTTFTCW